MNNLFRKKPVTIEAIQYDGQNEDVIKELTQLDITNLTPLDALNTIYRLQNKLKNRW